MKYFVDIEGRSYEIEIGPEGVKLGGRPVAVDVQPSDSSRLWHLVLDGRRHTLRAHREGRGVWEIVIDGRRHRVTALDERWKAIREVTGTAPSDHGPIEVKAPIPGLVVAVQVGADEHVVNGQGLVIIEAMKMENEMKATCSGRVADVMVTPGQAVNKGDTLLVIEPLSGDE